MDNKEIIISKVKKFLELVRASDFPMQVERAYLYGSFAKGTAHENSDIDVALVVDRWKGNYLEVVPPMWMLRRDVDIRIEPIVIVPDEDYAGFLQEIQKTGIELV